MRKLFLNIVRFSVIATGLIVLSSSVQAASIQQCNAGERRCIIRLTEGVVGDTVNVLNEKAQLAATGWITKRNGALAIISFKRVFKTVKRGYPVVVNIENRGKEVNWAAAFNY